MQDFDVLILSTLNISKSSSWYNLYTLSEVYNGIKIRTDAFTEKYT